MNAIKVEAKADAVADVKKVEQVVAKPAQEVKAAAQQVAKTATAVKDDGKKVEQAATKTVQAAKDTDPDAVYHMPCPIEVREQRLKLRYLDFKGFHERETHLVPEFAEHFGIQLDRRYRSY